MGGGGGGGGVGGGEEADKSIIYNYNIGKELEVNVGNTDEGKYEVCMTA